MPGHPAHTRRIPGAYPAHTRRIPGAYPGHPAHTQRIPGHPAHTRAPGAYPAHTRAPGAYPAHTRRIPGHPAHTRAYPAHTRAPGAYPAHTRRIPGHPAHTRRIPGAYPGTRRIPGRAPPTIFGVAVFVHSVLDYYPCLEVLLVEVFRLLDAQSALEPSSSSLVCPTDAAIVQYWPDSLFPSQGRGATDTGQLLPCVHGRTPGIGRCSPRTGSTSVPLPGLHCKPQKAIFRSRQAQQSCYTWLTANYLHVDKGTLDLAHSHRSLQTVPSTMAGLLQRFPCFV